jgi:hypothetical protein
LKLENNNNHRSTKIRMKGKIMKRRKNSVNKIQKIFFNQCSQPNWPKRLRLLRQNLRKISYYQRNRRIPIFTKAKFGLIGNFCSR